MSECKVPPPGWSCSRGAGHEGPCAASPTTEARVWKPCPFCGGTDIRSHEHLGAGRDGVSVFSMCCYECGATFPNRYRRELLKEAWNRRSPEPGAQALAAAGYQMDETGFGTYKLTLGFPNMETLHAASDYVRRLRAVK